jgi:hypothetical protein
MKSILNILFLLLFSNLFCQNRVLTEEDYKNSSVNQWDFVSEDCNEVVSYFESDIENKTIFLYLSSGIAPIRYYEDEKFENDYGIYFFEFGCVTPNYKCIVEYNKLVFEYLTNKYGEKWMQEIRSDVIEVDKWIMNYKIKKFTF